ncbi:uncharacterized protein ACA1_279590 [Acanthamoeba castellanii str. Neff]|uniref:Fungal lipase-type domain-containing protein n=1 Tax=Acanthamoeba castellanii (strain ATCC 30010 / Neff) TaxID=1257118 RepID=L8H6W8_ACACF|nr:uncharacterized protein ACA1_279590 [Acanthamoeba castellanii str. Neff]ELR20977.1 hypothetical protein ACA1_279590 [Acanthamoeba castellanii str. Neff]
MVHRGYDMALLSLWDQIVAFINKARSANPALPLYFPQDNDPCCPHCVLIGEKTSEDESGSGSSSSSSKECIALVNGVYTFGQPKVGNREFTSELRARAAGVAFFRLTHDNDFIPFLPRRPSYVHCGTLLFLSHGHIVQGAEYSARFARHVFRKTSSKRNARPLREVLRRLLEGALSDKRAILTSLPKDVPLLHFHDLERAKQLREKLENLGDFGLVMERLQQLTLSELIDLRSVTLTVKQRKRENRVLGGRWLRANLWDLLQYCEQQQTEKINNMLSSASASGAGGQ